MKGIIFNIQRFTIHDGPGLRTEFFLKGCPLTCKWCSNPESQKKEIQLGVYTKKCITEEKCGSCKDICPNEGALNFTNGKLTSIDYSICSTCMACYDVCPSDAIKLWGQEMTVEECMNIIRKDRGYYEKSGGGITVSGGDPLMQSDFVASLFKQCKKEGFHTCIESDFFSSWSNIEKILPYSDLFIIDLKHMNTHIHKKNTAVGNEIILQNLRFLSKKNKPIILRIPIIPNFNDNMINTIESANFIINELDNNIQTLQLLSFMRMGEEKYVSLNIPYPMATLEFTREKLQKKISKYAKYFNKRGIHCLIGTKEKQL